MILRGVVRRVFVALTDAARGIFHTRPHCMTSWLEVLWPLVDSVRKTHGKVAIEMVADGDRLVVWVTGSRDALALLATQCHKAGLHADLTGLRGDLGAHLTISERPRATVIAAQRADA